MTVRIEHHRHVAGGHALHFAVAGERPPPMIATIAEIATNGSIAVAARSDRRIVEGQAAARGAPIEDLAVPAGFRPVNGARASGLR